MDYITSSFNLKTLQCFCLQSCVLIMSVLMIVSPSSSLYSMFLKSTSMWYSQSSIYHVLTMMTMTTYGGWHSTQNSGPKMSGSFPSTAHFPGTRSCVWFTLPIVNYTSSIALLNSNLGLQTLMLVSIIHIPSVANYLFQNIIKLIAWLLNITKRIHPDIELNFGPWIARPIAASVLPH